MRGEPEGGDGASTAVPHHLVAFLDQIGDDILPISRGNEERDNGRPPGSRCISHVSLSS
jgi:hypothetical protein